MKRWIALKIGGDWAVDFIYLFLLLFNFFVVVVEIIPCPSLFTPSSRAGSLLPVPKLPAVTDVLS